MAEPIIASVGVIRKLANTEPVAIDTSPLRATTVCGAFDRIIVKGEKRDSDWFMHKQSAPPSKVLAVNREETKCFPVMPSSTGLADAILLAYSYHRRLVLKADDIWTCIIQSLATHVNKYSEEYRKLFVAFEGKKMISVSIDDFAHNGIHSAAMWRPGVESICAQIEMFTNVNVTDDMTADFTTTDEASLITSKIVVMGAMQKYFDYGMTTCCGIPEVELLGTLEDWKKLMAKTMKLSSMFLTVDVDPEIFNPLNTWFKGIFEVIGGMVATFSGVDRVEWWSHIIDKHTTYGSGGCTTYNGWFRNLFLYSSTGNFMAPATQRIEIGSIPPGVTSVPFVFDDNGSKSDKRLLAGHVGSVLREDGAVCPLMAWAVADV